MQNDKPFIHILPHGRRVNTSIGHSLLESLIYQSIFLRSDCGGKGTCGKCKVQKRSTDGSYELIKSCQHIVTEDVTITIPESSVLSSHIMSKAPVAFPTSFINRFETTNDTDAYGIAVDLGTTTIAIYLCNIAKAEIISSLAVKNPQSIYGDDVMSRIGNIGADIENLVKLQQLVIKSVEWGIKELLLSSDKEEVALSRMVIVGNPTMIHIFAGIDPKSIGISPYQPVFYEASSFQAKNLGFNSNNISIQTLPQVSGFIGGDILAAAQAVDLESQPDGTLLIDLGTNGELMLKGKDQFYATSCATGPAFEGASISCGMQAIPGAINSVTIKEDCSLPEFSMINPSGSKDQKPYGICGVGVINAVAQFYEKHIITPSGAFSTPQKEYVIVEENRELEQPSVYISQKDIRTLQLGKSALITGIEFLLKSAGVTKPRKIIIAGAFGSYLNKKDLLKLGIIPEMDPEHIEMVGNAAGSGAVMALCDEHYIEKATMLANKTKVVDLACRVEFQEVFVKNLSFQKN
jgi:uncharacterized 2Fe-2S/4Fe-4S cluster protein (DUF4445 family)